MIGTSFLTSTIYNLLEKSCKRIVISMTSTEVLQVTNMALDNIPMIADAAFLEGVIPCISSNSFQQLMRAY